MNWNLIESTTPFGIMPQWVIRSMYPSFTTRKCALMQAVKQPNDHSETVTYNCKCQQRTNNIYFSILCDLEILGRPNWESTLLTSFGKGSLNGPYKVWLMPWLNRLENVKMCFCVHLWHLELQFSEAAGRRCWGSIENTSRWLLLILFSFENNLIFDSNDLIFRVLMNKLFAEIQTLYFEVFLKF